LEKSDGVVHVNVRTCQDGVKQAHLTSKDGIMGYGPYRSEAMTFETPSPAHSGIVSPWTHLVEEYGHGTVLRFWLDDDAPRRGNGPLRVVYECLAAHVTDVEARWLIDEMFFVILTQHYYQSKIHAIAYQPLGSSDVIVSPYPARREQKN